jgi:hypothetical protein
MGGVLLDPRTGRPTTEQAFEHELRQRQLPAHIRSSLERAADLAGPFEPRASRQGWEELLYAPIVDGTAVTGSAETIMVPDYTLPANYMTVGKTLKYTLWFRQSTAITTPGTITLRLRWGGVAGVLLAASPAFAPDPTAAATALSCFVQYYLICRSDGASGTFFCMGQWSGTDFDDASTATIVGNLNSLTFGSAGSGTPATASVDTTTAKALSATYQSSVTTGSMTAHMAFLESLN